MIHFSAENEEIIHIPESELERDLLPSMSAHPRHLFWWQNNLSSTTTVHR